MKLLNLAIIAFVTMFLFGSHITAAKAKSTGEKTLTKIGYVNLEMAVSQELLAQNFLKNLEKKYQNLKEREEKARKEFETKVTDYRATEGNLSEQARAKKGQELSSHINSLQQNLMQEKMKLDQEHQQWSALIEKENRRLIEEICKEKGFSLVLNSAVLLFASDDVKKNDITAMLVAAYNKANPLEVKKPAAKAAPAAKKKRG